MRQFIILGYFSTSKDEPGECLYLGSDRGAAMDIAREPEEDFVRKSMFELAIPHFTRHFEKPAQPDVENESSDGSPDDPEVPGGSDVNVLDISHAARNLAAMHDLTDEQLGEIEPTGAKGKVTKHDVEEYILLLEEDDSEADDPEVDDPEVDDPEVDDPEVDDPEVDDPEEDDPEEDDPEEDDPEEDE